MDALGGWKEGLRYDAAMNVFAADNSAPDAVSMKAEPERAPLGQGSISALSMKWAGLHDAAATIAAIAGIEARPMSAAVRNLPGIMRDAGGWRRARAEQGVEDLAAMMEPALAALLTVCADGDNPAPAARVLYQEFTRARDALLALAPPTGAHRRST